MPSLPAPEFQCVSVPVLKINLPSCPQPCCPSPCGGGGGGFGGGLFGKRKRRSTLSKSNTDCTDIILKTIIQKNIGKDNRISTEMISIALRIHYNETAYFGVTCTPASDSYFSTTIKDYCMETVDGTTCSIVKHNI
uniref:Ground-like domain-containing protein n=1 Tax=Rhabditophanes sp. KR3021 TaxID=114890 RepID=A0AC35U5E5_9BILA